MELLVLPTWVVVVAVEAHHLEQVATAAQA
jgi:hypothetical protein